MSLKKYYLSGILNCFTNGDRIVQSGTSSALRFFIHLCLKNWSFILEDFILLPDRERRGVLTGKLKIDDFLYNTWLHMLQIFLCTIWCLYILLCTSVLTYCSQHCSRYRYCLAMLKEVHPRIFQYLRVKQYFNFSKAAKIYVRSKLLYRGLFSYKE